MQISNVTPTLTVVNVNAYIEHGKWNHKKNICFVQLLIIIVTTVNLSGRTQIADSSV